MNKIKTVRGRIKALNAIYGYEKFAESRHGWPEGKILVCERGGFVERSMSRKDFLDLEVEDITFKKK